MQTKVTLGITWWGHLAINWMVTQCKPIILWSLMHRHKTNLPVNIAIGLIKWMNLPPIRLTPVDSTGMKINTIILAWLTICAIASHLMTSITKMNSVIPMACMTECEMTGIETYHKLKGSNARECQKCLAMMKIVILMKVCLMSTSVG